MIDQFKVIKN